MKDKKFFIFLMLAILVLCFSIACNIDIGKEQKSNIREHNDANEKYLYHSDDYGFTLEIPEWKYDVMLIEVVDDSKSETADSNKDTKTISFVLEKRDRESLIRSFGSVFEIVVSKKSDLGGYFLKKLISKGDKTFYYHINKDSGDDGAIEEMIEELKPMHKEIKDSFRIDD